MDIFKTVDKLSDDQLHPKYKILLDPQYENHRNIIQGWVDGFIDRDNKIVKEFQTTYHSSLWEFYLHAMLKELGFKLNQGHDRPDFIINDPQEIYVEAVVSNIRDNGMPESKRNMDDIMSMFIPPYEQRDFYKNLNEAIIRQSNSILSKKNKYKKNYSKCEWINNEKPYVIALSSYDQINYGAEYIYPMMALLYGKYYNVEKEIYEKKESVKKQGSDSTVPIGIFNDMEYSDVSAIIYTSTLSIGKLTSLSISRGDNSLNEVYCLYRDYEDYPYYKLKIVSPESPEDLLDGIFIFHNPNAKNKLPIECFANEHITQITVNNEGNIQHTKIPNLIVRTDSPKILHSGFNMMIQEYVRHYNKCSMKEFYNIQYKNGSNIVTDEVDFTNDCCVYIIGTNIKGNKDDIPILGCKYERPCVMPNKMLEYEAKNIAKRLIEENTIGAVLNIIIVRNSSEFKKLENLFSERI